MKTTAWMALALAVTALAGCTESNDEPMLTEEDCAALGLVLGHKDVMEQEEAMDEDESMEDGDSMDTTEEGTDVGNDTELFTLRQANETEGNDTELPEEEAGVEAQSGEAEHDHGSHGEELACVPAGPPATVGITNLNASTMAYIPASFNWVLSTDATEELHAMDTQVRVSMESIDVATLGMPDTYGDMVAQFEHQNFMDGQTYEGSFMSETPGTFYFRAYAVVNGENLWSDEVTLEVTEVVPTGVSHTITCNNGGAQSVSSCTPGDLAIELGDGVNWANGNPSSLGGWDIHKTGGPDGQEISTTDGAEDVIFLVPGAYNYEADGDLGSVSGSITVSIPTA